jgi:hypothetical protein
MDPVHIEKGGENAQEQVDNCLHRLRQMMLDSENTWDFDMDGDGQGTVVAGLHISPKVAPAPKVSATRDVELAIKVSPAEPIDPEPEAAAE